MSAVIEVEDLSFRYQGGKTRVLKNIGFQVERGEFFCIIGSNGSGKSSLCNALVGLIPSYFRGRMRGRIRIMGEDTQDTTVAKLAGKIGLVFQNPFNQLSYTADTVEEELAYGLTNIGMPREEMKERVHAIAKIIRVERLMRKSPLELSGGQVQRVAIGSVLVMAPQVLVLDECTTQLDPLGSEEIFDIVKGLNSQGITVVMVDHDMERVARYADRIMAMEGGTVLAIDTPAAIFGDIGLTAKGVDIPDYSRFSLALAAEGLYSGSVLSTETGAVRVGRNLLGK
ncbi:MAG: ATP-binding cassette domain-containing protein [Spirochaetaceae bacterium]|jgi:energy-coupling factor transport system ATP-binding protein|nr:ATP-binding cassette domain-containing protein [Spirochaetaceae bacterium]